MSSQVTCVYHVQQGGESLSALAGQVAAVSVPADILAAFGVRVISDSTSPGSGEVVRTVVFGLNPSSAATATATLDADKKVVATTITAAGAGYVAPPVLRFNGGEPYKPAIGRAYLKVNAVAVTAGGSGYTSAPSVVVTGELNPSDPHAKPARLHATLSGGAVNTIVVDDPGAGYVGAPTVSFVGGGGGSGAAATADMALGEIVVDFPGEGYISTPTIVLTPRFQSFFPPASDQAMPFRELMTSAIAQAVMTACVAEEPVVA